MIKICVKYRYAIAQLAIESHWSSTKRRNVLRIATEAGYKNILGHRVEFRDTSLIIGIMSMLNRIAASGLAKVSR